MTTKSTSESSAKSSAEVKERIHAQERSQPVARACHSALSVVLIRRYQRLVHGLALVLPFRLSKKDSSGRKSYFSRQQNNVSKNSSSWSF